jgi:hypothetical protein
LRRLWILVAAAALGAATFSPAAPAGAETLSAACTTDDYYLSGTAFYAPVNEGVSHSWYEFDYTLGGGMGDESNVHIRLYENSNLIWAYSSPDNRDDGSYIERPNPSPVVPASSGEAVQWTGIFDEFGPDPRCTATTATV